MRQQYLIKLSTGDLIDREQIQYVHIRELTKGTYPGGYEYEHPPAVFIRLLSDPPGSASSFRFEFATNEKAREFLKEVTELLCPQVVGGSSERT